MIEDIEEFGAELHVEAFPEPEILGGRKVHISEAEVPEHVAAHVPKSAHGRRQHEGAANCITAEQTECGVVGAGGATIKG